MSRKPGGKPKLSEAEQLAAETLKMEAKLQVLKAEMAKQRMEADVCVLRALWFSKFSICLCPSVSVPTDGRYHLIFV